ncbi:beta-ketoacyl synthase N-terminal-like domain-containing protein [Streptomyces sp. NPDC048550]|uniref:beta-ketoacyl synthase N-terminal-like domain-containing protein n=1 Tax=Streptomyces sp. NPDC048550 TaxID=3155739 RepID=UPI0034277499
MSIDLGARGGAHTPVSACASGAEAIALGLDLIRLGRADVVVAGGTEACIHPLPLAGFAPAKAHSTRNDDPAAASRPFDTGRDGFVIWPGARRAGQRVRFRRAQRLAGVHGSGPVRRACPTLIRRTGPKAMGLDTARPQARCGVTAVLRGWWA